MEVGGGAEPATWLGNGVWVSGSGKWEIGTVGGRRVACWQRRETGQETALGIATAIGDRGEALSKRPAAAARSPRRRSPLSARVARMESGNWRRNSMLNRMLASSGRSACISENWANGQRSPIRAF